MSRGAIWLSSSCSLSALLAALDRDHFHFRSRFDVLSEPVFSRPRSRVTFRAARPMLVPLILSPVSASLLLPNSRFTSFLPLFRLSSSYFLCYCHLNGFVPLSPSFPPTLFPSFSPLSLVRSSPLRLSLWVSFSHSLGLFHVRTRGQGGAVHSNISRQFSVKLVRDW